ncbi:MAG: hypothetical protein Q4Q07_07905 [Tissierellia bacterium]|nr:hypothetical protein [Tissierellia bacterium]
MKSFEGFENLKKYYKKYIRVEVEDGKIYEGVYDYYTKPGDNDPEIESIDLTKGTRTYIIDTPTIVNIEIIKNTY